MKTEILNQEKNTMEVKADFTAEEVAKAISATYRKIGTQANIPGFRKGKIPRKMMELYFPKATVLAETLETLISDAIDNIIDEYELDLINTPDIKAEKINEGEAYSFTVKFESRPEVELPELGDIEVEKITYATTDEMVEERIKTIIENHSELEPTYEDRAITKDDIVSIKYDAIVCHDDGKEEKVQEAQKVEVDLAAGNVLPEVLNAVIGKKPGDAVSVELNLDTEEAKKDHAEKSRYEMEILGIMKKKLPELTDEFVTNLMHTGKKTVEDFRVLVRKQLENDAAKRAKEAFESIAIENITDKSDVEVPQLLIDREVEALKKEQEERFKREGVFKGFDDFFEKSGMTKEAYEADIKKTAERIVKRSLVIEAIADANDIQAKPEEVSLEIKKAALMSGVEPKKLEEYVKGDRERLFNFIERVRRNKTITFIAENVKAKEPEETKPEEEAK